MAGLTKENVLGNLSIDLILKGERFIAAGNKSAGNILFNMAIDVVSKPRTGKASLETSGEKPKPSIP
jgi:hypothetical protein